MAEEEKPECFGDPDEVCPIGPEGFPEPQQKCLTCNHLKPCLRAAWTRRHPTENLSHDFEEDGAISKITKFCRRWSRRKLGQSGN